MFTHLVLNMCHRGSGWCIHSQSYNFRRPSCPSFAACRFQLPSSCVVAFSWQPNIMTSIEVLISPPFYKIFLSVWWAPIYHKGPPPLPHYPASILSGLPWFWRDTSALMSPFLWNTGRRYLNFSTFLNAGLVRRISTACPSSSHTGRAYTVQDWSSILYNFLQPRQWRS